MRSPEELTVLFRAQGRRITPQRQCIFRTLQGDLTHPTAEAVYGAARREMDSISLKTVYDTLNELVSMGEIGTLDVGMRTTRFDPNVEAAHHHLVCWSCGKVRDLYADFGDLRVPGGRAEGFEVGRAEVVFRGLCAWCRSRVAEPGGGLPTGSSANEAAMDKPAHGAAISKEGKEQT